VAALWVAIEKSVKAINWGAARIIETPG
jgi:hypothetical protein